MARTSKSRGAGPFQMRSGNASPYKFLGKLAKKVVGATAKFGNKLGIGGKNDPVAGALGIQKKPQIPGLDPHGNMAIMPGTGGSPSSAFFGGIGNPGGGRKMGGVNIPAFSPIVKKEEGYTPYKQLKSSSPLKGADPILVSGARDAATGFGTAKYGQIAGARAWTDMVNTVETTVNDSSKTKLAKNRRASKRYTKSKEDMNKWLLSRNERLDRKNKRRNKRGKEDLSLHDPNWTSEDPGSSGGTWDS